VPPDDVEALAAALFRLLESPDLRRRLGESGRRRVLDLYDWNASVSTMLAAYETVLPEVARSREAPPVPWSR
jgi:glycosyltransferase involved in cell wall biosynthesis